MQKIINDFAVRLQHVDRVLHEQGKQVLDREGEIFGVLRSAVRDMAAGVESKDTPLKKIVDELVEKMHSFIAQWNENAEKQSEVRADLEKYGSGLIVAVFGRTNAGKSTLGNFMRGKQLRHVAFDNAWKSEEFGGKISKIKIIARGQDSEVEEDAEWFKEGSTETTREAQLFTAPGLVWLDTPGFGSTTPNLGALAKKYVSRADVVLYLDHADNPGLASISREAVALLSNGRITIIGINHSDDEDNLRDEHGKRLFDDNDAPIMGTVPKSDEVREGHNKQLKATLVDNLGFRGTCDAVSFSMKLVEIALENNDEAAFQGSNIAAFLQKLCDLIATDEGIRDLKRKEGLASLVALIDSIVGDSSNGEETLQQLKADVQERVQRFAQKEKEFVPKDIAKELTMPIGNNAIRKIRESVTRATETQPASKHAEGESTSFFGALHQLFGVKHTETAGSVDIDLVPLLQQLDKQCAEAVFEKTQKLLGELWGDDLYKLPEFSSNTSRVSVRRQSETFEYEVTEVEHYRRDPTGIKEHVCSWFGKEYYGARLVKRKQSKTVDLGFNIQEAIAEIQKSVLPELEKHVENALSDIRQVCICYGKEKLENILERLKTAEKNLRDKKDDLQREMDGR